MQNLKHAGNIGLAGLHVCSSLLLKRPRFYKNEIESKLSMITGSIITM